jgi:CheY-like chemotaxis protein
MESDINTEPRMDSVGSVDKGADKRRVTVLHLEDNENDRSLVREMLRADGLDRKCVAVQSRADFEAELLSRKYDLIISDFTFPSFDGMNGLAIAHELAPRTPFIFFSCTIGEETAGTSVGGAKRM